MIVIVVGLVDVRVYMRVDLVDLVRAMVMVDLADLADSGYHSCTADLY